MTLPVKKNIMRDPVYQQLNERLRELARELEFTIGDQFLTERQIAERFGVSRPTANKALASLVSIGFLEFRKGVGTFVRAGGLDVDLRSFVSFTQQAKNAGKVPTSRLLNFERKPEASGPASDWLKGPVYEITRLRLADDVPVIHEYRVVSATLCPRLTKTDAIGSIYGAWAQRYGLKPEGAHQTIRAETLSGSMAEMLESQPGAAALIVLASGFATGEEPLWWEKTIYRADAFEFRNALGAQGRPAQGRLT